MKALAYSVAVALVALSLAAPFWVRHRAQTRLATLEGTIQRQALEISRLSDANNHAAIPSAPELSHDELRELLRLRAEISRLHEPVAETEKLRAAVQTASQPTPAPARAGPDFWPKDQLAYAGSSTPEATLQTALWAMKNGDVKAMLSCLVPEAESASEEAEKKDAAGMENQFKEMGAAMTAGTSAFRLVDKRAVADEEVTLQLSFEGEGVTQDFTLKRIGSEWKLQGLGSARFSPQ